MISKSKTPVTIVRPASAERVRNVQIAAWSLSIISCLLAILAWGGNYNWKLLPLSAYTVFPLLGMLAFSLMWAHYVAGAVRELAGLDRLVLKRYFSITSAVVLGLILLHPGLLIWQRWRDGYGLPPGSATSYVAPGLGWVVVLGMISFFIFLAFEFHRLFGDRKWFQYVKDASDVAMLAILYHGWKLAVEFQPVWYRYVWIFYAIFLIAVLVRKYKNRIA
jgi:hypothetical protein